MEPDERAALTNFVGFLLLPGVVSAMRGVKGGERPLDFLVAASREEHPGMTVINKAKALRARHSHILGGPGRQHPTTQQLAQRVDGLVDEGRFSAAAVVVGQIAAKIRGAPNPPSLPVDAIREHIQRLHPDADEHDILPASADDPVGVELMERHVTTTIERLNVRSASGATGWTNQCIRTLMLHVTADQRSHDERREAMTTFTAVCNQALAGKLHLSVAWLWATSRAALIPKDNGTGWRPLGIGESWYRLMGRAVLLQESVGIGRSLLPHQLAVGIKGGCEIGARLAQVIYDHEGASREGGEEMCLIQMDLENAFNRQSRRRIFEALCDIAPGLARLFRVFYGQPSRLYLASGEHIGTSATGVRQGDPLAMLFFSVGQQPTVVALSEAVRRVRDEVGSTLPAGIVAYADDTSVYIGERGADLAARRAVDLINGTRMRVKIEKCRTLVRPGRTQQLGPAGGALFPVVEDGLVVLGSPTGTDAYRQATIDTMVEDMAAPLPALTRIAPQPAYALLQLCFNTRPRFMARVSEPRLYWPAMGRFDIAVDDALAAIARVPVTPLLRRLRALPQRFSGLGLPRHQGGISEKACLDARETTLKFVDEWLPDLRSGIDALLEVEVGRMDQSLYRAEIVLEDGEEEELERRLPEYMLQHLATHKRDWLEVYQSLLREGRHHHAAWFMSSAYKGTGSWLLWRGGTDGRFRYIPSEFVEALRLRLLIDPVRNPRHGPHCTLCDAANLEESPLHPLDCNALRPARRWRHDRVRDALIALFKGHFEDDLLVGGNVTGERWYEGEDGVRRKVDIVVHAWGSTYALDVAVVDPSAPTYIRMGSAARPDVAARHRGEQKIAYWREMRGVRGVNFVPFVVEATGRLGPHAYRFFHDNLEDVDKAMFYQRMNAAIARWNARMVLTCKGEIEVPREAQGA